MGDKQYKTNSYTDFFYYAFRNVLLVSVPLLVISTFVLGFSVSHSSATNSGSDNLAITISSSCTLSSVVNVPHNAEVYNGNYLGDIGKTTITTLCNDGNGYSVYAVGYSNNEEGNNKLINSERPEYSIDTGLNTSGLTSQWAMKLNNIPDDSSPTPPTIESAYNNTYGIVPSYWTKVASRASGTTDMAEGSSFTTTYAVYASSSQYTGTYNGQVKYLLTHPSSDAKHFFMQNVAEWKDQMVPHEGDSIQAIDERDGKSYWVTRLADGNIWMTQNLDFDIVADTQDPTKMKTLTSEDTDLTDHSLTGAYSQANGYSYDESTGITSWTPANSAKTINFTGTTVTGWQNSNTIPYSANKTDDSNTGHASSGNYYNWTVAIASSDSSILSTDTLSNIQNNPKNSICPKGWRLPNTSQTDNEYNEFGRLLYNGYDIPDKVTADGTGSVKYQTDGFVKIRSNPLYFVRSGIIRGSVLENSGIIGTYWASMTDSSSYAYGLSFNSSDIWLAGNVLRNDGRSVRCVAR